MVGTTLQAASPNESVLAAPSPVEKAPTGVRGRPRVSRYLVRRDELCAIVDEAAKSQLVVVRGPAAAGKTSLLVDWADRASSCGRAGVWIDAALVACAESFWLALQRSLADVAAVDVAASLMGWQEFAVAAELVRPVVIVLDGLSGETAAELHDGVVALMRRTAQLTVIVSSRGRTEFESQQTLVDEDCVVLGGLDLRLSEDEVSALLARRGAVFSSDAASAVREFSSGHAGAVTRLAVAMCSDVKKVWRRSDIETIAMNVDVGLDAWLWSTFSPAVRAHRELIMRTASLPSVTPGTLALIGGGDRHDGATESEAEGILVELENAGLGRTIHDSGTRRFTYAAHVKLAVQRQVLAMDAQSAEPIRRDLLRVALEAGDSFTALEQAFAMEDWAMFSSICATDYAVIARDHFLQLHRFLDAVPKRVIDDDAWLSLLAGASRQATQVDGRSSADSVALFDRAEKLARDTVTAVVRTPDPIAIRIASARRAGRNSRSLAAAEALGSRILAKGRGHQSHAPASGLESVAQAGITFAHVGDYSNAMTMFAEITRDSSAPGHLSIQAMGYLALIGTLRGEVAAAERWLKRAREQSGVWSEWKHSIWAVAASCASALLAMETGDLRRAALELKAIAALGANVEEWAYVAYASGILGLLQGGGYSSLATLREVEAAGSRFDTSRHLKAMLDGVKSDLLLTVRQARPAVDGLREYVDVPEPVVGAFARALLFSGANQRAAVFAARGAQHHLATPRSAVECQIVSAVARARLGDAAGAAVSLEDAVSLADRHGLKIPLGMMPLEEIEFVIESCSPSVRRYLDSTPRVFKGELTVPSLTRREQVVLAHLRRPVAFDVIARDLCVSLNTVKSQARSLYRKLGVGSRGDAIRVAAEWRLLPSSTEPDARRVA